MNKARGSCGAGKECSPFAASVPWPPCHILSDVPRSCVILCEWIHQGSAQLHTVEGAPAARHRLETEPGELVGSIPSSPQSSSAAAAGCWCSHTSRSSQIQLHPRVQEREAAVLAPAAWAEFDSRRARGGVTVLGAEVTQVTNNSWPDVEPPPCTTPFLGGQESALPALRLQLCPLWGTGRFGLGRRQGSILVGKKLQPPRLFPSIPWLARAPRHVAALLRQLPVARR